MNFCRHYNRDSMKCDLSGEYVVSTNVYDTDFSKLYCMSGGKAHKTTKEILELKGDRVPENCPVLK